MADQAPFNDHNEVTVNAPLTVDGDQLVELSYNTNDFEVVGGELRLKASATNVALNDFTTFETIPAPYRVVFLNQTVGPDLGKAGVADSSDQFQVDSIVGIALGAAGIGGTVTVQHLGRIVEPTWTWVVGTPIYFDSSGILTQTKPSASGDYAMDVAKVVSPTEIEVLLRTPELIP